MQALDEGDLSERARKRAAELADPHNPDLRRCKAEVLFDQRKYELVLDLEWVKAPGSSRFASVANSCS